MASMRMDPLLGVMLVGSGVEGHGADGLAKDRSAAQSDAGGLRCGGTWGRWPHRGWICSPERCRWAWVWRDTGEMASMRMDPLLGAMLVGLGVEGHGGDGLDEDGSAPQ